MRALVLLALALFGCVDEPVCRGICPTDPDRHPQGMLTSIAGRRRLTIAGEMVGVREADGTAANYRFVIRPRPFWRGEIISCGPRPAGFGLRTFEIASSDDNTAVLRVRAEPTNGFVASSTATVMNQYGGFRSETLR